MQMDRRQSVLMLLRSLLLVSFLSIPSSVFALDYATGVYYDTYISTRIDTNTTNTYWYVDFDHGLDVIDSGTHPCGFYYPTSEGGPDTTIPWGKSRLYPFATLEFIPTTAYLSANYGDPISPASPDTIYVSGSIGGIQGSTTFGNENVHLIGISESIVDGSGEDSPTFYKGGRLSSTLVMPEQYIDGFSFDWTRAGFQIRIYATNSRIENCTFDSFTSSTTGSNVGMIQNDDAGDFVSVIRNCGFYKAHSNNTGDSSAAFALDVSTAATGTTYIDHCNVNSCSVAFSVQNSFTSASSWYVTISNSIFVNVDTWVQYNSNLRTHIQKFIYNQVDTFQTSPRVGYTSEGKLTLSETHSGNVYELDPIYLALVEDDTDAKWGFLDPSSPLKGLGNDGLDIGVTWSPVSDLAVIVGRKRNNIFFSRWARLLGIGL